MHLKRILVAVVSASLVSLGIYIYIFSSTTGTLASKDFNYIPRAEGWEIEEIPIGPTELVERVTAEILGFSYCKNYLFSKGPYCFELFVVFWKEGMSSEREVAGHVPEICYVNQGWKLMQKNEISPVDYGLPMWKLDFEFIGEKSEVIYFHYSGDSIVNHNRDGSPTFISYIRRMFSGELNFKKRQLLVRMSFPCRSFPSSKIDSDPDLQRVVKGVISEYLN